MKYLISSDWQFADYARLSRITRDGITSRLQEFCDCFEWMLKTAVEESIDEIVILGDFFDDRVSVPVTVLDKVARLLLNAVNSGFEFHLLVGNHDAALKNPNITSLRALHGLAHVYSAPRVVGPLGFVPWTGDVDTLSGWCADVAKDGADYLLSHVMVEGAVPPANAVPIDALSPKSFKRVLLGDVHDPVKLKPNIQYIGAPLQINFGDAGGRRGVWSLDTESDELKFIENDESPKFWNLDSGGDADAPIRSSDYVKIRLADPEEALQTYESLTEAGVHYVQNETVTIEDEEPRLNVRTNDRTEKVLRKYCQYENTKEEEIDKLVKTGLEIIEEAKVS